MVYDTFPFFNELELLEVRLHELDPVVDRFVLVEAPRTFSNRPKPLHFAENRELFRQFLPKITHVVVDQLPDTTDAWMLEGLQRRGVDRGLADCDPDDLILLSDVDEIPSASAVAELMKRVPRAEPAAASAWHELIRNRGVIWLAQILLKKRHPFVWVLEQMQFYHYLNCVSESHPVWRGTRAVRYRDYTSAFDLRRWGGRRIPKAGWHFSYMGGAKRVREKIQAYSHQEFNRPEITDEAHLEATLSAGRWALGDRHQLRAIPLDESFPAFVLKHRERFRDWLR